jgi:hypothetical protein
MSSVKGANRTIADDTSVDHTLDPGLFGGNVKVMADTYEAAALASGSDIEMGGDLPVGARVLGGILYYDALGGSVTLDVGDAEDPNRYLDAVDASSAGSTVFNLPDGAVYEVDETDEDNTDRQVVITTGGASATGTIKLVLFYTHE